MDAEELAWVAPYCAMVRMATAQAVFCWPDADERAYLARELPEGRSYRFSFRSTPDHPLVVVGAELGDVGRGGYVELFTAPIGDGPGQLPISLLPEEMQAGLLADVARAAAELPTVPDTVAALLN